jgi:hypothetical protein
VVLQEVNATDPDLESERLKLALRSRDDTDVLAIIEGALGGPSERAVMTQLFRFCAYGDVTAHDVVLRMNRPWLIQHSWSFMEPYLDGSDSQPFREFAILLRDTQLHEELARLLEAARKFDDFDIQEVVQDFMHD